MLHFLQPGQHLLQVLHLCPRQLLSLRKIQNNIRRHIHFLPQLQHVQSKSCAAIDCRPHSHSQYWQVFIPTSLLTLRETAQDIQHLLVVSFDLPIRTWSIWRGPGLHKIQQLAERLEKVPVKVSALVGMDDKRHTKPDSITLEKRMSHCLCILYTMYTIPLLTPSVVWASTGVRTHAARILWVSRPALNPPRHKSIPAARQTESDPARTTPGGTKPLLEPMLTNHQSDLLAFTWGQFYGNDQDTYPFYYEFKNW